MSENNKENMVDLTPVTEKSKRINKLVIAVIVFVLGALILYLVFGGKEKKKPVQPDQITTTANTASFITAEDMQKLAADAEETKQQSKVKRTVNVNNDLKNNQSQQRQVIQRQITADEKIAMERQRREWENAQKEQAIREKEDTVGHRSEIFFKIPAMDQRNAKNADPAVNQHYNSGDEDYIQVIGGVK